MDAMESRRWWALAVLCMGAFLSPLDFFIVNVALPAIKDSLHASEGALQLVIAGYGAAYAVLVVTGGRLGDIYGRKRIFLLGMAMFTLTSGICAMAGDIRVLIAARVVQGLSAALLAPQVLSTIRLIFPPKEQPLAMGIFGSVFGLASIGGQLLGGILMKAGIFGWTWQSVFMINIPVGMITGVAGMFILKENRPTVRQRLDIPGMLLITLALGLFIYPVIMGREAHWPVWIFGCLLASLAAGVCFVYTERYTLQQGRAPLIHLPLFKDRHFVNGLAIMYLYNHTAAFFLVYPYYLQHELHRDVLSAGLAVLPYAAGFFVGPLISPLLAKRMGVHIVSLAQGLLATGFVLVVVGLWYSPEPSGIVRSGLFLAGIGHGMVMPSIMRIILAEVASSVAGQAAGIVSTAIQVGSVMGVALLGTLFFALLDAFAAPVAVGVTLGVLAALQVTGLVLVFALKSSSKNQKIIYGQS
ncbi:MFS transporter [Chitinophaga qingshengii]|uniref:MFS transporter n=1 Tax=Chitinophaga qingshengii TaxID=1569794 RepID=A0ABR7TWR0_9BACT|nr:MFS transporter [Chitinophaga qingshengii]MBC9934515.1 MFS transporter [Chitinophaga qingshengii]